MSSCLRLKNVEIVMKKTFFCLALSLSGIFPIFAQSSCFLVKENQTLLKKEGRDCAERFSPASTFKIALALMGFDSGILKDARTPEWPYKKEYELYLNVCKYPHNPHSWMRDSCVWYSQVLTRQLSMKRFKSYVDAFHYGNQDVSGDKGKNNGLTHAWLSSSLAISPIEQVQFLQKIQNRKLPLSQKAYSKTKEILYLQELAGGWKLYGKTGNGQQLKEDKNQKFPLQHGWFVGWIAKDNRVITFAKHIKDSKKENSFASFRAKNEALIQLFYLIEEMEK